MKQPENLKGQRFERLIVIESAPSNSNPKWKCLCDCGNYCDVFANDLKRSHTSSCGCLKKERVSQALSKNLIDQKFGKLTVIKRVGSLNNRALWEVECDCGTIFTATTNKLTTGNTTSCGCIRSKGELLISKELDKLNIFFEKEFYFKDLYGKNNSPLRFDFKIANSNILIEYDGVQHFDKSNPWYSELTKKYDNLKTSYCKKNGYHLIRFNKIKDIKNLRSILMSINYI